MGNVFKVFEEKSEGVLQIVSEYMSTVKVWLK